MEAKSEHPFAKAILEKVGGSPALEVSDFETLPPKGEYVIIIKGAERVEEQSVTLEQAVALAKEYQNSGESASNAAKLAAKESGFKKSDIYKSLI